MRHRNSRRIQRNYRKYNKPLFIVMGSKFSFCGFPPTLHARKYIPTVLFC
jgi:hypothetical protein